MPAEMEICTRVHQARSAVVQPLVVGNLFRSTWKSGDLGCSDARQGLVVGARLNADSLDDRWAHAMALAALAPHLPAEELPRAMAAVQSTDLRAAIEILKRSRSTDSSTTGKGFSRLLRLSLAGKHRSFCLGMIREMVSEIKEIGGTQAIRECVQVVFDVD